MPLAIESCAEAGTDRALFDDGQRRRQRAGAQQDGEIVGALDGETAGNLAGAAEDRLANNRRRYHLLSSTMAKGLPTFSCVTCANLRAPDVLKRNETIGSLVR